MNLDLAGRLATARTFFTAFTGPCLYIAITGLTLGLALGSWGGAKVAYRLTEGRALRAERTLAEYKTETAKAIAEAAAKQIVIRDDVRKSHEAAQTAINVLASDLRAMRRDVRVCAAASTMRVPTPAPRVSEAGGDGQPRPADAVLQELAAYIAQRSDEQAAQLNALIDWLQKTQAAALD